MRPLNLDEYFGQEHIVGKGRLLRRMIKADQLSSLIFYGPPGTGKTTLARVIAKTTKSVFVTMNAVLSGVKQLREEIDSARDRYSLYQRKTILFVDEIHRWNKSQQDALLPWVENGTVILIGATTENPYFEVNSALVSRSRIFQLKPLTKNDLKKIADRAVSDPSRGYGRYDIEFEDGALEHLVDIAAGDARSLLNAIELAVETTPDNFPPADGEKIFISLETAEESIQKKVVLYDKEGDYHFDIISAFIKSIRGSDPDATLYWLAKMIRAGEDPGFIFRRMLISASEDIGLADPQALTVVSSAAAAFDRVGMPEGRFHLTQAALYLALAPKSNSALGFFDALKAVEEEEKSEVPNHLKDGGRDKEGFGHGAGYLYPHSYHEHWVAQQYLPDGLKGNVFYNPSDSGYEKQLKDEVVKRREANLEAEAPGYQEILSTAPADSRKDAWLNRMNSGYSRVLSEIRNEIFKKARISPHHRILVLNTGRGLLLWEACRRITSGTVYALPGHKPFTEKEYEELSYLAAGLPELERPEIVRETLANFNPPGGAEFERIIGKDVLTRTAGKKACLKKIRSLMTPEGTVVLSEIIPSRSKRLSSLMEESGVSGEKLTILKIAENEIYRKDEESLTGWDGSDIEKLFEDAGFSDVAKETRLYTVKKIITEKAVESWFNPELKEKSYGKIIMEKEGHKTLKNLLEITRETLAGREIDWTQTVCTFTAQC